MLKITNKKITAAVIAFTAAVAGITFMAVTQEAKAQAQAADMAVSYGTPNAGLSTEILLSSVNSGDIYVNFVSVSSVAQANIEQHEEIVETISESLAEIEAYADEAAGYAAEYDEAQEAYETVCAVLEEAEDSLEAAQDADTSVLASMYAQDMDALVEEAADASGEAQAQAQAAKEAEEKAAKEAEEKAAAEAAEKAAKEAEEKAAAEAKAKAEKEAAEAKAKAEEEAAAKAAEASQEDDSSSSDSDEEDASESSDADSVRQALVATAKSYVGVLKYKSGGTSLSSGVDCSGFTRAIYAKYGYSLPRSSSAQASCGRSVSVSDIKVGDLVCYSGHVGIYIGNGKIVHAPGSGQYVKISSMYIMKIKSVRRIIE